MEAQELKDALANLSKELEGKSAQEIKNSIEAFEAKNNEFIAGQVEEVRSALQAELKQIQDYADSLDLKMQEMKMQGTTPEGPKDEIKSLIGENFEEIKTVRKGHSIELKVVGNMTLGTNLTGDQPRVYGDSVAMAPAQPINFSDLVSTIQIDGGTYTFPQETGSEGGITTQVEGSNKSLIDYDFTMVDVNTDFLAGYAVYSKKMSNNLPFLENFLPQALRRDYFKAENSAFYTQLSGSATASTLTAGNRIERLISEMASLLALSYMPNVAVVNPADYAAILVTAGSSGTGDYSLPGVVTINNGMLMVNGLAVLPSPWVVANKYIIGDWNFANKVVTQGLGVNFFEQDSDNVRKNNITARVEAQVALAVTRPDAFIFGDFTTVA